MSTNTRRANVRTTGVIRRLKPSEIAVVRLVAEGFRNASMATQLGVTFEAVKYDLRASFEALGAQDRANLVAIAIREGYVEVGSPTLDFSRREMHVVQFVAAGLTNVEVGEKLRVEPSTVKTHLANLCKRGARNRAHAVTLAAAAGLLPAYQPHGSRSERESNA